MIKNVKIIPKYEDDEPREVAIDFPAYFRESNSSKIVKFTEDFTAIKCNGYTIEVVENVPVTVGLVDDIFMGKRSNSKEDFFRNLVSYFTRMLKYEEVIDAMDTAIEEML